MFCLALPGPCIARFTKLSQALCTNARKKKTSARLHELYSVGSMNAGILAILPLNVYRISGIDSFTDLEQFALPSLKSRTFVPETELNHRNREATRVLFKHVLLQDTNVQSFRHNVLLFPHRP